MLTLSRGAEERTVAVKPVSKSEENTLAYEDWVAERRHLVDSLSNGRLGYLHIRAMNQPALDRFQRELISQTAEREGLVVDVRYNGGGWIAVHLLGMLERRPFVMRNFRGGDMVSENKTRAYGVEKPMTLLINHYSASNSEIFAEGWRRLGLGKIVGYPTAAAVIGTAAYELIDGTICRRPSWGAWTVDMENLEGNGRRPDIQLFNTLTDWNAGRDLQLERAVQEMLTELR
jgi:C-terminal processing protease CtpA/Prc